MKPATAAAAAAAGVAAAVGGSASDVDAGGSLHAALGVGAWTSLVEGHNLHHPAASPLGMDNPLGLECGVGEQHPLMRDLAAAGTCSSCGWRAACHQGEKRSLPSRREKKKKKEEGALRADWIRPLLKLSISNFTLPILLFMKLLECPLQAANNYHLHSYALTVLQILFKTKDPTTKPQQDLNF